MKKIVKRLLIYSLIGMVVPCATACAREPESVDVESNAVESSFVESTPETIIEQEITEYDNRILEAYHSANGMAGWFRTGTVDCVMDDYVEKDGIYYNRVKDYATLEDLQKKLCEVFSQEYARELIESSSIEYVEIENVLYAVVGDRGTDVYVGEESYQVDGDDSAGTLTVTVEILAKDDTGKVEGYKSYVFPYIIENGAVLFTDFPVVR